jgi:hypothetical protein
MRFCFVLRAAASTFGSSAGVTDNFGCLGWAFGLPALLGGVARLALVEEWTSGAVI